VAPQLPGERVLQTYCRNANIDLLFVRADDIPEYVQDGVVDCGVTGLDLVAESGCAVDTLLQLDFGFCSLQVAVPLEDGVTSVGGSVELTPRLGLSDAIVDLVSTGSTLRTNGLRSLGTIFESEAAVIGPRSGAVTGDLRTLITMLQAVVEARKSRYLLFNVPATALDDVIAVLPSAGSPSVVQLADQSVVAVQTVVPSSTIWQLLPELELRGASAILTLPIERMVR
jgi:ATP phosphoribosyltransferase